MPGAVHARRNQPTYRSTKEMRLSCTPLWLLRAECEEGRTAASEEREQHPHRRPRDPPGSGSFPAYARAQQ
jgi:hypothetical protein